MREPTVENHAPKTPMHKPRDNDALTAAHQCALEALQNRNRYRALAPRANIDFSSNDYLALANAQELAAAASNAIARCVPLGATGSRLLRGNHPEHEALEAEAAQHFGAQSALFFASGFLANYALFSTLPMREDLVVYDELIHASVHDGMKAGKSQTAKARHNDPQSFENAIRTWKQSGATGRVWIAVESLYSMDGDRAPLKELQQIAVANDAFLVIDEAHATGVYGPNGRGLSAHLEPAENIITMHTCGKALGVMGALICAPTTLIDYMINRSRALIYATAPSPLIAATVRAALKLSQSDNTRRKRLSNLVKESGKLLKTHCGIEPSGSQILPIIVGSPIRALAIAEAMQLHGFDVRAIRPPTVPKDTSRLRLSLTLNVSTDDARAMIETLAIELDRLPK